MGPKPDFVEKLVGRQESEIFQANPKRRKPERGRGPKKGGRWSYPKARPGEDNEVWGEGGIGGLGENWHGKQRQNNGRKTGTDAAGGGANAMSKGT